MHHVNESSEIITSNANLYKNLNQMNQKFATTGSENIQQKENYLKTA
jgi:hypothetical protein